MIPTQLAILCLFLFVSAGRIPGPDGAEPDYNLCEATVPDASTYAVPPGATLELVQIITRHGDRTPTEHLPNDNGEWDCSAAESVRLQIPSQSDSTPHFKQIIRAGAERGAKGWANKLPKTNCLLGQLTKRGIQQHADLGAALRSVYVDLLGFLPKSMNDSVAEAVYVRATDSWRTKQSALALFSGLYSPGHVAKEFVKDLVVYPLEADTLKGRGALAYCPRFRQLRRQMYLGNKAYEQEIARVAPGLQRTLETLLGTTGKGDFDAKVTGWDSLSGWVPPRFCNGKPMPCNVRGECVTVEQGLAAVAARQVDYAWMYRDFSPEYSRLYVGPLMGELTDMARGPRSSKLQIFSAHDSTVAAMIGFLNATSVTWPPLRSNLIFEYWKRPNGTKFSRIVYNGAIGGPKAAWCDFTECDSARWFTYIDERTPQDLERECIALEEAGDDKNGPVSLHGEL
ncbi:Acid phosphatase-like protein 2 [Geranomyces variabilis]|uniref:Acid phosphatase-like protein 2 n=1 Tax=Geranomyces variabilis TaxID=109894 RepID=A0AAD5TKN9_9FUNG|nr:Acid phosphatase-like protein 2 [Geranomyces variabilis]